MAPDGDAVDEGFLEEKCTELPADNDSDYDSDCADSEVSSVCSDIYIDDDLPFICDECGKFFKQSCGTAGTLKMGSTTN